MSRASVLAMKHRLDQSVLVRYDWHVRRERDRSMIQRMFGSFRRRAVAILAVATLASSLVENTFAAKFNKVVKIGQKAPSWKELIGIDDKKHSLEDWKSKKLVVVVFTCNHCPVAQAYEKRLIEFTKQYKSKGVAVVAISVSQFEADSFENMKQHAEKHKFNFPYLYDKTQKSARKWGVTRTPQVFVLDQKRNFAYMGAVDDNMNRSKVTKNYLRDAVDATLSGKEPEIRESRQIGCAIDYQAR